MGIVIPHYRLAGGKEPTDPDFINELTGILEYATRRAEKLEQLPWADWPVPKKYAVINNVGGYGEGSGYGVRHTNKAVVEAECRSLRQLGVNGFRAGPAFLIEMVRQRKGYAKDFHRGAIIHIMGYPVPSYRADRPVPPGAGCPFHEGVAERTKAGVEQSLTQALNTHADEVWCLTVDEIGTVIDRSPEKKEHVNVCPLCAEGYRQYLKGLGVTPQELGKESWDEVKPFWGGPPDNWFYTRMFNNHISAMMFTPLKDAFDAANERKRKARERGEEDTPEAMQPWIYSYALRGNTFLMKGHSLEFFDFYRLADNGFVYETSNRGAQIWGWDSYLCDVGRVVSAKMNKRFGIYVKPHRGAPIQRALSALSRNCKMLYWYTYGPDYKKGDSFSQNWDVLKLTSKGAHLIGKAEDVLYGSSWMVPAEVAVVKPRASEILGSDEAWENAKWVYTALQHAHIPVDPLDATMLATEDLSRYKVIYISGSYLRREAAGKVAEWVKNGGTLYTSGSGLVFDQTSRPLEAMQPVLGLQERAEPEFWYRVNRYGASALASYSDQRRAVAPVPEGAKIIGERPFTGTFMPVIGREVLKPAAGTEVLAKFADGGAAATRHTYGKGQAYVVGFFPGLEYSAPVRTGTFNMVRDFDAGRRSFITAPALARVKPVVDASEPCVEGLLLKNDETGKRAVTLMNWAYQVTAIRKRPSGRTRPVIGIVPLKDLKVSIRGAGPVSKVTSAMLDRTLEMETNGDVLTVTVPMLEEGDVLLLE